MHCWQGISGFMDIGLSLVDTLSVDQYETRWPVWGNCSQVSDIGM